MTKSKIEKILQMNGKFLEKTSSLEKVQNDGARWRVSSLTKNGYGMAGGHYFYTLSDVEDWIEFNDYMTK